jgi:hypothetical protein
LTYRGLNLNTGNFDGFTLPFVSCGEMCLLISLCVGDRCDITDNDEDQGRRRLDAEDRGWSIIGRVLGDWTIERSSDAMCGLHRAQGDEECGFLGLALKPRLTVSFDLTSKPVAPVLMVWAQNHSLRFSGLGLKTGNYGLMICASKSPQHFLGLCLKTKWAMVYRLRHKTNGRRMARDMHRDLAACFA